MVMFFFLICGAKPALAGDANVESSWFKPALIENNDPACEDLLKDAYKKFLSDTSYGAAYGIQGYGYSETGKILDWQIVTGVSQGQIQAFGKNYYLDYLNHGGCGGACETNQPLVSDKLFPEPRDFAYLQTLAKDAPPAASYSYTIARSSSDGVYLFVVGGSNEFRNMILIYRLAREGRWASACKISTAPEHLAEMDPVKDAKVLGSLETLRQTVSGLMREAGNCGSMGTHWRWSSNVQSALQEVLYRPWVLRERSPGQDVDGSYQNDMQYLEQWSLLGFSEYSAFQKFQQQLQETTKQLAAFYHTANNWSLNVSNEMASAALKGAVSTGIRFYMYDPQFVQGEEALRRVILERQDINAIHAIQFDAERIDAQISQWPGDPGSRESILNIAVEYPEALSLLLQAGVNPNHINDFGKAPLMYAAQYNQVDAAKLLIKQGANVNAVTTKPWDSCYYTLNTFNMTPLHYAVRYASPELVRLLLDNGAQPFIKAENRHKYPMVEETPLDWLHRYTAPEAIEKNPNIPDEQVARIEQWLSPLTTKQVTQNANNYVLNAEDAYQKGNFEHAYRNISLARQLQPSNQRVLSDLSLIALKNGNLGESLEASTTLIESQADDKTKANAWFNQGLACEKYQTQSGHGYLTFNGNLYCKYGVLYPYVRAYDIAPTNARKDKLKTLFDEDKIPYCEISTDTANIKINFQMGANPKTGKYQQLQTLFVLHGRTQQVTSEELAWDVRFNGKEKQRIVPEKVGTFNLDDKVMSVFETSITYVQFPYRVFDATCNQRESMELPKSERSWR
ncbi:MAG: ankyrin repeat domain-containing protein [Gammaproteobacteria bacterium]